MSTIKTTYIQHPSATSPNLELAADGTVVLPLSDLEDLANVSGSPTDGQVLSYDNGTSSWNPTDLSVSGVYVGTRYYTSSGTFSKADPLGTGDIGLTAVRVQVVGGGGGGGDNGVGGGGGGSGGYSESFIQASSLASSETVTVGAGGGSRSNGGGSSFGSLVTTNGGGGASGSSRREAGSAAAVGTGDLACGGGWGGRGFSPDTGIGGASYFGQGGRVNKTSALAFGAGGGGTTSGTPGSGKSGVVVVHCFA